MHKEKKPRHDRKCCSSACHTCTYLDATPAHLPHGCAGSPRAAMQPSIRRCFACHAQLRPETPGEVSFPFFVGTHACFPSCCYPAKPGTATIAVRALPRLGPGLWRWTAGRRQPGCFTKPRHHRSSSTGTRSTRRARRACGLAPFQPTRQLAGALAHRPGRLQYAVNQPSFAPHIDR